MYLLQMASPEPDVQSGSKKGSNKNERSVYPNRPFSKKLGVRDNLEALTKFKEDDQIRRTKKQVAIDSHTYDSMSLNTRRDVEGKSKNKVANESQAILYKNIYKKVKKNRKECDANGIDDPLLALETVTELHEKTVEDFTKDAKGSAIRLTEIMEFVDKDCIMHPFTKTVLGKIFTNPAGNTMETELDSTQKVLLMIIDLMKTINLNSDVQTWYDGLEPEQQIELRDFLKESEGVQMEFWGQCYRDEQKGSEKQSADLNTFAKKMLVNSKNLTNTIRARVIRAVANYVQFRHKSITEQKEKARKPYMKLKRLGFDSDDDDFAEALNEFEQSDPYSVTLIETLSTAINKIRSSNGRTRCKGAYLLEYIGELMSSSKIYQKDWFVHFLQRLISPNADAELYVQEQQANAPTLRASPRKGKRTLTFEKQRDFPHVVHVPDATYTDQTLTPFQTEKIYQHCKLASMLKEANRDHDVAITEAESEVKNMESEVKDMESEVKAMELKVKAMKSKGKALKRQISSMQNNSEQEVKALKRQILSMQNNRAQKTPKKKHQTKVKFESESAAKRVKLEPGSAPKKVKSESPPWMQPTFKVKSESESESPPKKVKSECKGCVNDKDSESSMHKHSAHNPITGWANVFRDGCKFAY